MSLPKQSKIVSRFLNQEKHISFGDTQSLINYIFFRSNKGKLLFKNMESNLQTKTLEIMNNIKVLHQNCGTFSGQKSNILALVAGTHTQKSLKDFGFTFSHKQYKLAREKAVIGQFDLNPGEKKIPQSKTRIPEDVVEKINSILIEQSIPSSKTIVLAQKTAKKQPKRMTTLQRLMAEFRDHLKFNDLQRKAFRKQQLDLDTDSYMIVADFKENFRMGGGPVEASSSF
ncbi:hypothetical protein BB560_006249 [Smittium megazygosporum]|uniref:Uncharacterized protein n=1 Tax=Smittium megazygosporum TaxID=133381 RepID=A0A2T9YCG5_9FUNG|nr:hypothetical protein BB560_006249 [Smittium megazygosporum]